MSTSEEKIKEENNIKEFITLHEMEKRSEQQEAEWGSIQKKS